jgi:hypothetical protein
MVFFSFSKRVVWLMDTETDGTSKLMCFFLSPGVNFADQYLLTKPCSQKNSPEVYASGHSQMEFFFFFICSSTTFHDFRLAQQFMNVSLSSLVSIFSLVSICTSVNFLRR